MRSAQQGWCLKSEPETWVLDSMHAWSFSSRFWPIPAQAWGCNIHIEIGSSSHRHTCSEQSLRILMWNASYVQKHSNILQVHLAGMGRWNDPRNIEKVSSPCSVLDAKSWKLTLPFKQSQIVPTLTDCENRAKREIENRLFGNGMVVLGLATSLCRKLTWKMKQVRRWASPSISQATDECLCCAGLISAPGTPCRKFRSFTSIQMVHTHAPLPRGFLRLRLMRWRWKWKENGNETTMKMRWQLLYTKPEHQRGNAKKGKEKGKTPTPTHLAQNGQTLKGQGTRRSGRTTGQTPTRGGGADRSAWHNLQGESQNLPRHAKDPNLT